MVRVKMVYVGPAARVMGTAGEEAAVAGATLRELWVELRRRHGPGFDSLVVFDAESSPNEVLLNGRNVRVLQGLDTPLQEGDRVAIMAPFSGG